jgi:hypothetical protein
MILEKRASTKNQVSVQRKSRFSPSLPLKDTFIGDDGGRRPIAEVYFQQSAARNKPNTYVVE